jgi:2-dehydro-3-deoxyphosphooctonate aldolase (KDO 8-P synthase)
VTVRGTVRVGAVEVGGAGRVLLAGPCVLEEPDRVLRIAEGCRRAAERAGLAYIFKASFDKANRSRVDAFRGPGLDAGLALLARVREAIGCPVTTDVHETAQVAAVAQAVDLLQVPAFLCRQTDLLAACGASGRPVNVKKGQFLAPDDLRFAIEKARGPGGVLVTERGTAFGYGDLVVDFRGLVTMRALGVPVVYDATHSVQRPGGGVTGGDRQFVLPLLRAAVAVGVDAVFAEVHDDPAQARSDAASQWPLDRVDELCRAIAA